ncbi:YceI family protein [Nocardia neocaledoniensis]|uniref:YceI family protein n=1 Tax=Nocardia neocaledoniensis TaxID=236511 RepID=UPI002455B62D|nr:YceI family protein [Nocardia neocaledoniensis]
MNWIMLGERRSVRWAAAAQDSTAHFRVGHFGHTVQGSVPVLDGRLTLGPDGQPATVSGAVDLAAITTGNPRRDRDLRKPRLLDLDRHPVMSFVADDITGTDGEWRVAGVGGGGGGGRGGGGGEPPQEGGGRPPAGGGRPRLYLGALPPPAPPPPPPPPPPRRRAIRRRCR